MQDVKTSEAESLELQLVQGRLRVQTSDLRRVRITRTRTRGVAAEALHG